MADEILVFKISKERIADFNGSIYEAGRGHWFLDVLRASKCLCVAFVILGENIIKEMYRVKELCDSLECPGKKIFKGERAFDLEKKYAGKLIHKSLRIQGRMGGRLYTTEDKFVD